MTSTGKVRSSQIARTARSPLKGGGRGKNLRPAHHRTGPVPTRRFFFRAPSFRRPLESPLAPLCKKHRRNQTLHSAGAQPQLRESVFIFRGAGGGVKSLGISNRDRSARTARVAAKFGNPFLCPRRRASNVRTRTRSHPPESRTV